MSPWRREPVHDDASTEGLVVKRALGEGDRQTESGIEVKPVYTGDDVPELELEPPGEYPFTRGPYRDMYRGRPWTIRQYAGFASAEETNAALPLPPRPGPDRSLGRVRPPHAARLRLGRPPRRSGRSGGRASRSTRIADMEVLFDGIPLGEVSTSMTINAPAALLLLLYELVAEGQGVPGDRLRGTVQNDILKEYVARGNYIFPPRPSMRITTDLFAYCHERLPRWNTISISGYHIREAGSTAVQELAFTLANGIAYCEAADRSRPLPGRVRRAALLLLQRAQPLLPGGGEVPRGAPALGADHAGAIRRDEPAGAGASLPRADGRLDAHRAAAGEQHRPGGGAGALGGRAAARSPFTRTRFDEALALPTERSARIALRTQQILASEAGGTDTADPLGGAYFIEALTTELEERARELIERIDEIGGAVEAVERGLRPTGDRGRCLRARAAGGVGRARRRRREPLRRGRARRRSSSTRLDPAAEQRQIERTERVRAERDAAAAARARAGARGGAGDREPAAPDARGACGALHDRRDLRCAPRRVRRRTTPSSRP